MKNRMNSKMKKVLLVTYDNSYTMKISQVLQDLGYKVRILNVNPKKRIDIEFGVEVFNYYYVPGNFFFHSLNRFFFYTKTGSLFMRQNTDIVLCMDEKCLSIIKAIRQIPLVDKIPYVVFDNKKFQPRFRRVLKKAGAIVLPNDKFVDSYKSFDGEKGNLTIINYGVDFKKHNKKESKIMMRLKGLIDSKKQKVILSISSNHNKVCALLGAMIFIPDYKLLFLGDKTELIEKLIKSFKLTNDIVFYKPNEELDIIYSGSDVFYIVDEYDMRTIRAMKHNIPVVWLDEDATVADLSAIINELDIKKVEYPDTEYSWETFGESVGNIIEFFIG